MNKKNILFLIGLIVTLLLVLAGCSSDAQTETATNESEENKSEDANEETITLKLASGIPSTNSFSTNMEKFFMDKVTELTNGEVQFEHYPGEQLGKSGDLLNLTKDGVTDIGYVATPYYASELPISNSLVGMPGLYQNGYQGTLAYQEISQKSPILEMDFLANGIRPVAVALTTPYEFFTNGKEINAPEDVQGLKVRSPGGVANHLLQTLGANPVSVTTSEMFEAFDRGVVDTLYMFPRSLNDAGLGELVKYGTQGLGLGGSGMVLAINEKVWQSLPEHVQKAMKQAGIEAGQNYARLDLEKGKKVLEEWDAAGIVVKDLSESHGDEWKNVTDEFNQNWLKEKDSEEFSQAFEMFQEEVKKHP